MKQQPDDPSIEDTDMLWRTCVDLQHDASGPRIKSSVFKTDGDGEVSVDVARFTNIAGTFSRAPANHEYIAVVKAQVPRSFEIVVGEDKPARRYTVYLWDDGRGNLAHAHIHPPEGIKRNDSDRCAKRMAMQATIERRPLSK